MNGRRPTLGVRKSASVSCTFDDAMHTSLHGSPTPLSSNVGSPDGSAPDLERTAAAPAHGRIKSTKFTCNYCYSCKTSPGSKIASKRFPRQWPLSRLRLQVLSTLLAASAFETFAASASSVSGSARSWPLHGQLDGSTAAGSHGPGSPASLSCHTVLVCRSPHRYQRQSLYPLHIVRHRLRVQHW